MKILIADDSAFLRQAVRKLLEGEGYEVVEAEDGVEAITQIFEHSPQLILLDVTMPRLGGYVTCRLIKEDPLLAAIPVLILTARDSAEDRYWAERSGADGFLTKDSLGEGLLTSINAALASHALMQLNGVEAALPPTLGEVDVLSRVCEMLDKKLFETTIITELLSLTDLSSTDELMVSVFEHLGRLVSFDLGAVAIPATRQLHALSPVDVVGVDLQAVADFAIRHLGNVTAGERIDFLQVEWIEPPAQPDDGQREWGSWYASPIRKGGESIGLLILAARRHGVFDARATRTLRTLDPALARVIGSAIGPVSAVAGRGGDDEAEFRLTSM